MAEIMSRRQYKLTAAFLFIIFKISMLPKFISMELGRDGFLALILLALIDFLILILIYNISLKGGLKEAFPTFVRKIFLVVIIIFFLIKFALNSSEVLYYFSSTLFENKLWNSFIISLVPVIFFLGARESFNIGRLSEIIIWIILIALTYNIVFTNINLKLDNVLPLFTNSPLKILSESCNYFWYLGDTLPLIFIGIRDARKDIKKQSLIPVFAFAFLFLIGYFLICFTVYGNTLHFINNVVIRLAAFNKISDDLTGIDLPIIIASIACELYCLTLITYGVRTSIMQFEIKKQSAITFYSLIAIGVCLFMLIFDKSIAFIEKYYINTTFSYFGIISVFIVIWAYFLKFIKCNHNIIKKKSHFYNDKGINIEKYISLNPRDNFIDLDSVMLRKRCANEKNQ